MIIAESRTGRRIVGRLERGDDLFGALLAICRERGVRAGEIRGLGSFETVELAEYDQASRVWKPSRTISGGMELLTLTGNVSERDGQLALHAHVTVMRDRDTGIEILGGHLVSARVFAFELVIDTFDDLLLRRAADPATGLVLWREAIPLREGAAAPAAAPTPSPPPRFPEPRPPEPRAPSAPTWSQVAEASARKPPPAPAEPEPITAPDLSIGDIIVHPAFGRCDVQRLEGDEFVHLRLRNGRLVRLSLDVVSLQFAGSEGGKNVFKARVEG